MVPMALEDAVSDPSDSQSDVQSLPLIHDSGQRGNNNDTRRLGLAQEGDKANCGEVNATNIDWETLDNSSVGSLIESSIPLFVEVKLSLDTSVLNFWFCSN